MKTVIDAPEDRQEIFVKRTFDLPVELLFRAYEDAALLEQWMGTKVIKLENRKHGAWQFETTDKKGKRYGFNGVIHEFEPGKKITRTFEMENAPFSVQLEFLEFEPINKDQSLLKIHIVYKSADHRDRMLKMGMSPGMNMAHDRLQTIAENLK